MGSLGKTDVLQSMTDTSWKIQETDPSVKHLGTLASDYGRHSEVKNKFLCLASLLKTRKRNAW